MRTEPKIQLVFVESICTDPEVLKANIQMKQKSPDYKDMNPEDATRDFLARLTNYEAVYREIPEVKKEKKENEKEKKKRLGMRKRERIEFMYFCK